MLKDRGCQLMQAQGCEGVVSVAQTARRRPLTVDRRAQLGVDCASKKEGGDRE